MTNYDYFYNKAIIHEFESNNTFIKVTINNNDIICSNKVILKDIKEKIKDIDILFVTFYTSLYDYEELNSDAFYDTIKNLPLKELPIYRKNSNISEYLEWMKTNFNNDCIDVYETGKFTKRQTSFDDKEKCLSSVVYENTNYKFNTFNQLFYHCGNIYDYERFGSLYLRTIYNFSNDKKDNKTIVTEDAINNTFDYLFNYMKKGILVGIKSNKLAIFLPFSKYDYENDFYEELYFDEEDKKLLLEYKKSYNKDLKRQLENNVKNFYYKNHLDLKDVNLDRKRWYSNDCIFRNQNFEGDQNECLCENFLKCLCEERILPDCVFFVNLRDHPMLRKDYKHAYDSITTKQIPEKYFKNNTFAPIFSPGCSSEHLDIPFVTPDDWLRISQKYFPDDCKNGYYNNSNNNSSNNNNLILEWKDKKNIAIFRGSLTGCNLTINDNMRLKASYLSLKHPTLLDAGITSFNRKMKKQLGKPITIINTNDVKQYKKNFIDNAYKSQFKYILNIDGHVSAFRLSHELSLNSVVLLPESKFYMWFSKMLKPFIHYVPIKSDLSNLIEMIEWCKNNDEKCKVIAENGYNFYVKHLGRDGILDYMQHQLNNFCYVKSTPLFNTINNKIVKKIATSIGIITPYRNDISNSRLKQKRLFYFFMENMLRKYLPDVNFTIIVAEQFGNGKFNIGKLKNVGYLHLNNIKKFDNYVFLDIDTYPSSELIKYLYYVTDGMTSLAVNGSRYNGVNGRHNNDGSNFVLGVFTADGKTFEKNNGYSLMFKGWGGEDDNLIIRSSTNNITIYLPEKKAMMIDMEEIDGRTKTMKEKYREIKQIQENNLKLWETLSNIKIDKSYGLKQTKYNILNEFNYKNQYNNTLIHIIVDLNDEKQDDEIKNLVDNFQYNKKEIDNYQKILRDVKTVTF